jgi:chemotaxis response regulator CheB
MINNRVGLLRVVGIGASAGGLNALSRFLPLLKPNGQAVYIIAQHMAKDHPVDLVLRLLQRHSALPVVTAGGNDALLADRIYLIPPGVIAVVNQVCIELLPVSREHISSPSVDALFHSIARDVRQNGIGIILSGAGMDGVSGCRSIKAHGGKVIVQALESCQFEGMPAAVVRKNLADEILFPEQIAERLNVAARIAAVCH